MFYFFLAQLVDQSFSLPAGQMLSMYVCVSRVWMLTRVDTNHIFDAKTY